jgi:hypothetical protein
VTWDGKPEHRNLRKEGNTPPHLLGPEERLAYVKRIIEASGRTDAPRTPVPDDLEMPPDPFSGTLPGAMAQAEMLHSLIEGGMTEPQALYYLACLVQVGLAMRMGRFDAELPPPPEEMR